MAFVPKATEAPTIKRTSVKAWEKGTVTALDDGRTPIDGLRSSGNVILDQDSTIRPRGSLTEYGPQPADGLTIIGEIYEFVTLSGATRTTYNICMQTNGTVAKVYYAQGEDDVWTLATGTNSYNASAPAHFKQSGDRVSITNGEDTLSYMSTATFAITTFVTLSDPTPAPTGTPTGLTGTNFNVYYAITANSTVGETAGSPVLTKPVSTDRDVWDPSTQNIKVQWTAVTGAVSYNLYMGVSSDGAGQPKLYAIATGLDASVLEFTDNGTRAQDLARPMPTTNNTSGPKATRAEVINGRLWLVGDKDHPYYVWHGGDFNYEFDFSPGNGGGYTPVGTGTKEVPNAIKAFRDGQGNAKVMVLQQGTNGSGKRSFLTPTTVTYGSSSFVVWEVQEDYGQDGTDAADSVIVYQNSTYYLSRDGFKTTGTKPQLQNVLSTDRISNTIQTDIQTINTEAANKAVGLAYEGRLYWALPVASATNNQIWVLDLDRKGAWMKPWNIAADWMWLYNDNAGRTHFCMLVNNRIMEMSYSAKTADNGVAFPTSFLSGQNKFSEDGREWGRLIQLVFVILRPQGTFNFSVTGMTEDGLYSRTESVTYAASSTRAGYSEPGVGYSSIRGYSGVLTIPTSFNPAVEEHVFEFDEDVQWYQYSVGTTEAGSDFNFSDVIAEYVPVGIKDLA